MANKIPVTIMIPRSFRISPRDWLRLARVAKRSRRKPSELVRIFVEERLDQEEPVSAAS